MAYKNKPKNFVFILFHSHQKLDKINDSLSTPTLSQKEKFLITDYIYYSRIHDYKTLNQIKLIIFKSILGLSLNEIYDSNFRLY